MKGQLTNQDEVHSDITRPMAGEMAKRPSPAPTSPRRNKSPAQKRLLLYYEMQRSRFLPIKPPGGWSDQKDINCYIEIWDESDDYRRDTVNLMADGLAKLHKVLEAGISYFSKTRQPCPVIPTSALTLREKVTLFAELLPASKEEGYTLRFSLNLAWILWLDSERERLLRQPQAQWLFPFYQLADSFLCAALELEESLQCEHDDYDQPA